MSRPIGTAPLGTEFDAFLFAPVRVEPSGITLTVVSALARANIDPWSEAADLARLPQERASQRLLSLIGETTPASGQLQKIADDLISLLPHGGRANVQTRVQSRSSSLDKSRAIWVTLLIVVGVLGLLGAANRTSMGPDASVDALAPGKTLPASSLKRPDGS